MLPTAKVIAHSISKTGKEIATIEVKVHRCIWPEVLVHKDFSRSAASNRAIPIKKLIQQAIEDPALPVFWGKNQPGMQSFEELNGANRAETQAAWLEGRDGAVKIAERMASAGAHKQLVNRVLEPYTWITAVITATNWHNALSLRCHKDAEPSCRAAFEAILDALNGSTATLLEDGAWHTPYVQGAEINRLRALDGGSWMPVIKASTARCARVSYLLHGGEAANIDKDMELHDRLVSSGHYSPAEHTATPSDDPKTWANLKGWMQYRRILPGEYVKEFPRLRGFKLG